MLRCYMYHIPWVGRQAVDTSPPALQVRSAAEVFSQVTSEGGITLAEEVPKSSHLLMHGHHLMFVGFRWSLDLKKQKPSFHSSVSAVCGEDRKKAVWFCLCIHQKRLTKNC